MPIYAWRRLVFDTECIHGDHPYRDILTDLAKVSLGMFAPTQIKEKFNDRLEVAQISFKHAGKLFSCEVRYLGDGFEFGVLDLVNAALAATGVEPRLIPLPSDDQFAFLVFVPLSVYKKAARARLVPADNEELQRLQEQEKSQQPSAVDEKLLAQLGSANVKDRRTAIVRLGATRTEARAAFPVLAEGLRDPDRLVRLSALDALVRVGARAVPTLEPVLDDKDAMVRLRAACSLLRITGHATATAALTDAMQPGRDKKLRANAFYEAVKMGAAAEPLLSALVAALDDRDRFVAENASLAIQRLRGKARPALPELLRRLNEGSVKIQRQATTILGAIGAKAELVPHLIKALSGKSRYEAVNALGDIGPAARAAVPYIVEALGDADITWFYAAHALKRIGPPTPGASAVLLDRMTKERSVPRRWVIAKALADLDPKGAVAAIPLLARDVQQKKNYRWVEHIREIAQKIDARVAREYGLG